MLCPHCSLVLSILPQAKYRDKEWKFVWGPCGGEAIRKCPNDHIGCLSSLHGVSSSSSPCTFFYLSFCIMFFGFGHSLLLHISPKYHTPCGKPREGILVEWGSIAWPFCWPECLSFLLCGWCGVGGRCAHSVSGRPRLTHCFHGRKFWLDWE